MGGGTRDIALTVYADRADHVSYFVTRYLRRLKGVEGTETIPFRARKRREEATQADDTGNRTSKETADKKNHVGLKRKAP